MLQDTLVLSLAPLSHSLYIMLRGRAGRQQLSKKKVVVMIIITIWFLTEAMARCIVTIKKEIIYAKTENPNVHKFYLQQNNLQHEFCLYELWY